MKARSCHPSAAERWGNCPRSLALAEEAPDVGPSWHSARGHVLHYAASCALPALLHGEAPSRARFKSWVAEGREEYAEECNEVAYTPTTKDVEQVEWAVDMAAKVVGDEAIRVDLEVQFPPPLWLPMRHGPTIDVYFVRFDGSHGIVDYKFGNHRVKSNCVQLMIYAATVLEVVPNVHGALSLTVVQPPYAPTSVVVSREEVHAACRPYVAAAIETQLMEATSNPDDYHAGSWCHFCPAKGICPLHQSARRAKAGEAFACLIEKE